MRRLVASEWVTLDGVFDAHTMEQWWNPYDSDDRAAYIQGMILASDAFLLGRVTYEMLAPYWSALRNNEMGIADRLNSAPKYVVSSTLRKAEWDNSTIIKEDVMGEITRLKLGVILLRYQPPSNQGMMALVQTYVWYSGNRLDVRPLIISLDGRRFDVTPAAIGVLL